jgi:hypothetical protein
MQWVKEFKSNKDTRPNLFSIASVALEKCNLQAALIVINARVGSAAVVETGRESSKQRHGIHFDPSRM